LRGSRRFEEYGSRVAAIIMLLRRMTRVYEIREYVDADETQNILIFTSPSYATIGYKNEPGAAWNCHPGIARAMRIFGSNLPTGFSCSDGV
jgi:hypothetical protein